MIVEAIKREANKLIDHCEAQIANGGDCWSCGAAWVYDGPGTRRMHHDDDCSYQLGRTLREQGVI